MASIDDNSSHDLINKRVVVVTGFLPYHKEGRRVFMPSSRKLRQIKQNPKLSQVISFTKSMTSEDVKKVLQNTFPILANTER